MVDININVRSMGPISEVDSVSTNCYRCSKLCYTRKVGGRGGLSLMSLRNVMQGYGEAQ